MSKYRPTSGLVEIQFELRGAEDPLTKTRNDTHYAQYSSPQLIGWYSWATL